MPKIINPNAILNGYIIEFPTVGFINKYYKVDITPTDQSKLAHPQPQFLPKPKAGTIYKVHTVDDNSAGKYVVIQHDSTPVTWSLYYHMSRVGNVSVGQQVSQGQVLGYVGSTGHSTGPHLHFEVRQGSYVRDSQHCIDPKPLLLPGG